MSLDRGFKTQCRQVDLSRKFTGLAAWSGIFSLAAKPPLLCALKSPVFVAGNFWSPREQGGVSGGKLAWPRPRSEAEIAKSLIFPRLLGDRPPAQRKNGAVGKLSMKCPIDDRVTAQQGSPAEPHQQRLYSMPTSQLATKCPIAGRGPESSKSCVDHGVRRV